MVAFYRARVLDGIKGDGLHGGRVADLNHLHPGKVDLKIHVLLMDLVFSRFKRTGGGILDVYVDLIARDLCLSGRQGGKIMLQDEPDRQIQIGMAALVQSDVFQLVVNHRRLLSVQSLFMIVL